MNKEQTINGLVSVGFEELDAQTIVNNAIFEEKPEIDENDEFSNYLVDVNLHSILEYWLEASFTHEQVTAMCNSRYHNAIDLYYWNGSFYALY